MTEEIPREELDIHVEQNDEGYYIARVFHRASSTIKISDGYMLEQEAIDMAIAGVRELVAEKRKGLAGE